MEFKNSEKKYQSNIYKSYIYHFILGIHTVNGIHIPYMTIWGGLTFFEIMLLQSYFTFIIFILEIPSGAIADFLGRKTALSLSAIAISLAALFYSIVPILFLFVLAETFWAFGIALFSGTDEAFLYLSLKKTGKEDDLPKILGRNRTMRLIALTFSAPLGSVLAALISLQFAMIFLIFTYIIAFFVSLTFKEPIRIEKNNSGIKYLNILKEGFKELKRNKILRILCFDRVIFEVLVFFLFWTYQPYLQELSIPIILFGFIASLMNITNAVFMNLIPRFSKKIKTKIKLLILFNLIIGFAYLLMAFTTNMNLGIILILIIVAFGYTRSLLYVNGINKQIESENRATVLSTVNMFGSLISAILFPFIGLLVMWNIYAVFFILGILIIIFTAFTRVKNEYL